MIVFKVVRREADGRLISAAPLALALEYKIKRKIKPKKDCGPLCAFNTSECAKRWIKKYQPHFGLQLVAYLAKAEPSSQKRIWGYYPNKKYSIRRLPKGTVLCDSITLQREISG